MGKTGLTPEQILGGRLSTAQSAFDRAYERSTDLKIGIKNLKFATKAFTQALKDKDIVSLFAFEKVAQEYDYSRTKNLEKRKTSLAMLETVKNTWTNAQDPSYAKIFFDNAHSGMPKTVTPEKDSAVDNNINSLCRRLNTISGELVSPQEKAFYLKRQECLKFIGKEHNLRINQHLGLSKGQDKGLER